MRGLAAAALALAVAIPATAQRGGGHASFSGHSAPAARPMSAFHGTFAPRPAFGYGGAPLIRPPSAYSSSMRGVSAPVHYPLAPPVRRPVFYQPNHGPLNTTHRFIFRSRPFFNGFAFLPTAIYLPYDGFYNDSFDDYDTPQQPAPQPDNGYNYPPDYSPQNPGYAYPQQAPPPPDAYAYPQPMPEYAPPASAPPQMQYVPGSSDTVTLIYKDGRPPEQIQNYLATRSTLTILDNGRRREVALSDLDLPATVKANRQTGVDFELPTTARQ